MAWTYSDWVTYEVGVADRLVHEADHGDGHVEDRVAPLAFALEVFVEEHMVGTFDGFKELPGAMVVGVFVEDALEQGLGLL